MTHQARAWWVIFVLFVLISLLGIEYIFYLIPNNSTSNMRVEFAGIEPVALAP